MPEKSNQRPVSQSLKEYGRGIAGGLLFSLPLILTMEVWHTGFNTTPLQLILVIVFTFILLLGYNRFAGMRPEANWGSVIVDSVEEIGIGFVMAFLLLVTLRRIDFETMSLLEITGVVVMEAMIVSIGVSVGTAQLGVSHEESEEDKAEKKQRQSGLVSLIVLSLCGGVLIGGSVAPTDEVFMIGVEALPGHVLAMALLTIVMSALILFFSGFERTSADADAFTVVQQTCVCYLVALASSAVLLWLFGRLSGVSFWVGVAQTVTLGMLTSLGTSAGRLIIDGV